jgi:hypothetical protein
MLVDYTTAARILASAVLDGDPKAMRVDVDALIE